MSSTLVNIAQGDALDANGLGGVQIIVLGVLAIVILGASAARRHHERSGRRLLGPLAGGVVAGVVLLIVWAIFGPE